MIASGRETLLDEELTEEQVEEELAPVTVQLAYTAAQLGRTAEALSTYEVSALLRLLTCSEALAWNCG